jgi:hypothetical protein
MADQAVEVFSTVTDGNSPLAFGNNAHTATLLVLRSKNNASSREQR